MTMHILSFVWLGLGLYFGFVGKRIEAALTCLVMAQLYLLESKIDKQGEGKQ